MLEKDQKKREKMEAQKKELISRNQILDVQAKQADIVSSIEHHTNSSLRTSLQAKSRSKILALQEKQIAKITRKSMKKRADLVKAIKED